MMSETIYIKRGRFPYQKDMGNYSSTSSLEKDKDGKDNTVKNNKLQLKKTSITDNVGRFNNQQFEKDQREIKLKILDSTQKSLGLLENSEDIAIATTRELHSQREQLEKTVENLNNVTSLLKTSEKHVNSIKSTFGMFKNFIYVKLEGVMSKFHKEQSQLELPHGMASAGDTKDLCAENLPSGRIRELNTETESGFDNCLEIDEQINNRLNEMSHCVAKLKGLALDMGGEVELQNKLIDHITTKTDSAVATLQKQNKDVNKLLK